MLIFQGVKFPTLHFLLHKELKRFDKSDEAFCWISAALTPYNRGFRVSFQGTEDVVKEHQENLAGYFVEEIWGDMI